MNHKYALKLTKYSEAGSLTNDVTLVYCDSAQELAEKKRKYEAMRYQTVNEETGTVTVGMKMYDVKPMISVYQQIDDFDDFCTINGVIR